MTIKITSGLQQSLKDSNSLEPNHTCFPAGTLVHTDKGLVPIQDIKVGDMVLSRPEWGGRDAPTEYKRVVRAFCSGEEEVVRVSCQKNSEYGDPDALRYFEFMTPNHPIWDETLNDWIPASNIEIGTLLSSIENEDNLRVLEVDMVWDSYTKGIGITYPIYSDESEVDFMVAFNNQGYKVHSDKFISDYYISDAQDIKLNLEYSKEVFKNYENKSWAGNRKPIKVPVYNLEVESFHTYFVGEQAIWVHNDNCFYEYDPNLTFANAPLPDTIKFNSHTCFPAGTLVHTDKGLVPIQDIKVGDMVLSRPEWGGRDAPTEYKRVVRAFCSGEEEIVRVSCVKSSEHAEDYPTIYTEFMTPQHPVWIESLREWLPVSDVILQWKKRISIEDIHNNTTLSSINNNDNLMIIAVDKIWDSLSTNEKIGIAPSVDPLRDLNEIDMIISFEKTGYKVDYDKYNSEYYFPEEIGFKVDDDVIDNYQSKTWAGNSAPIKIPVYNLEIEDYHTYFIGEHGVWVHNCGGE